MTNENQFENPEQVLLRQIAGTRALVEICRRLPEGEDKDKLAAKVQTIIDNTETASRLMLKLHGKNVPDVH